MSQWRLIDGRNPVDDPGAFLTTSISSETDLRKELDRLAQSEPGIVSLTGPSGTALQIGIGGSLAGLRWYRDPSAAAHPLEILSDHPYAAERIDFLAEGDTIAFWPEHLMPVEQAVEIIVHVFKHERLPDWIAWKEWDSSRGKWTVHSPARVRSA